MKFTPDRDELEKDLNEGEDENLEQAEEEESEDGDQRKVLFL
jgi:hypothetical protein